MTTTIIDFERKTVTVDGYSLPMAETSELYRVVAITDGRHKAETWTGKQVQINDLPKTVQKIIDKFNLDKAEKESQPPPDPVPDPLEVRIKALETRVAALEGQKANNNVK